MSKTIVVAKTLVRDAEGSILVLRRSKTHPRVPLAPDLPGGEIDGYEDITEGLVREIAEETGLIVKRGDCRLLFTSTQWEEGKSRVRLLYDVRVALVKPDVQISWEHDRFEWLSVHQAVTALMHPEYSAGLQYAIKHELL